MAAKGSKMVWVRLRSKTAPFEWFVHPDLPRLMIEDAKERGTNLTDLATTILCGHFSVPYEPKLRRSEPDPGRDVMNFGALPKLNTAIRSKAARLNMQPMDLVRQVLCSHYGLGVPAKRKQTRRRKQAVAA